MFPSKISPKPVDSRIVKIIEKMGIAAKEKIASAKLTHETVLWCFFLSSAIAVAAFVLWAIKFIINKTAQTANTTKNTQVILDIISALFLNNFLYVFSQGILSP